MYSDTQRGSKPTPNGPKKIGELHPGTKTIRGKFPFYFSSPLKAESVHSKGKGCWMLLRRTSLLESYYSLLFVSISYFISSCVANINYSIWKNFHKIIS